MSYLFGKFGASNIGNTSGVTGTVNRGIVFAGGNNVTLSQSVNAASATLTISAANQTVQTQNIHNLTLSGNTAGVMAQVSSGTLTLAGGNNVTLSQNANAVTISAANQSVQTQNLHNMTLSGNTAGAMAQISSGTLTLAGGNNITLSQNGNAVTLSAANQTVQTQNLHNITLGGNTAGVMAQISSGTLTLVGGNNITLSQNGNAVTISGGAGGGGGGGIALANSQTAYTSGTANLAVVGGAMTIASTTGQSFNFSVPQTSSLSATGIINISTNGSTISIGAAGLSAAAGSYFDNMFPQNSQQALTYTSVSTGMYGRVVIQPLSPGNELFPYNVTASTMLLGFSNSGSSAISAAHSSSWYVGIYTRVNSTQLSLLNSVSTSYGMAAATNNSASYMGARWLSFHSSQWSSQPVFSADNRYFFAVLARTAGASYASISLAGMHMGNSVQRSGQMAAAASSNTSYNAWHPFMGVHSLTTHTALPSSLGNADINKASAYANFVPQVILDAGLGQMG